MEKEKLEELLNSLPPLRLDSLSKKQKESTQYYLAPHPVTFSIDGRKSETEWVSISINKYKMKWNGESLRLIEHQSNGNGNGNGHPENFRPPEWNPNFSWLLLIMVIFGAYVWYKIFKWIF